MEDENGFDAFGSPVAVSPKEQPLVLALVKEQL
jgi:hypothetical protein